jgi:hypothetical protein
MNWSAQSPGNLVPDAEVREPRFQFDISLHESLRTVLFEQYLDRTRPEQVAKLDRDEA